METAQSATSRQAGDLACEALGVCRVLGESHVGLLGRSAAGLNLRRVVFAAVLCFVGVMVPEQVSANWNVGTGVGKSCSTVAGTLYCGYAVDNNTATVWGSATGDRAGQWIEIDYLSSRWISGMRLWTLSASNAIWYDATVYISDDPSNWGSAVYYGWVCSDATAGTAARWQEAFWYPHFGRYVRIVPGILTKGPDVSWCDWTNTQEDPVGQVRARVIHIWDGYLEPTPTPTPTLDPNATATPTVTPIAATATPGPTGIVPVGATSIASVPIGATAVAIVPLSTPVPFATAVPDASYQAPVVSTPDDVDCYGLLPSVEWDGTTYLTGLEICVEAQSIGFAWFGVDYGNLLLLSMLVIGVGAIYGLFKAGQ